MVHPARTRNHLLAKARVDEWVAARRPCASRKRATGALGAATARFNGRAVAL
eukprot:SAG11_NODE_25356_length_360_cov_0.486590_1_plen_52_part_01